MEVLGHILAHVIFTCSLACSSCRQLPARGQAGPTIVGWGFEFARGAAARSRYVSHAAKPLPAAPEQPNAHRAAALLPRQVPCVMDDCKDTRYLNTQTVTTVTYGQQQVGGGVARRTTCPGRVCH